MSDNENNWGINEIFIDEINAMFEEEEDPSDLEEDPSDDEWIEIVDDEEADGGLEDNEQEEINEEGPIDQEIIIDAGPQKSISSLKTSIKASQHGVRDELSVSLRGVPNRKQWMARRKRHREICDGEVDSFKTRIGEFKERIRELEAENKMLKEALDKKD